MLCAIYRCSTKSRERWTWFFRRVGLLLEYSSMIPSGSVVVGYGRGGGGRVNQFRVLEGI